MTDILDRVSEQEELIRQHTIKRHRQKMTDKRTVRFCIDCQEDIPEIRQKMGCCRCVGCQRIVEKQRRIYRA